MKWTPEKDEVLRFYLGQGASAAEIARIMGDDVTRCAVVGRSYRLRHGPEENARRRAVRIARQRAFRRLPTNHMKGDQA